MRKFFGLLLLRTATYLAESFDCTLITNASILESADMKRQALDVIEAASKSNRRFARKVFPFVYAFSMIRLGVK